MSMLEWSRDAHQVTRNNGREDPELAALRARGHSLLAANWRKRVRGVRRSPVRPLGVELPAPSLNEERRKYYRLTELGRALAAAEAERLAQLVGDARAKQLIPKGA